MCIYYIQYLINNDLPTRDNSRCIKISVMIRSGWEWRLSVVLLTFINIISSVNSLTHLFPKVFQSLLTNQQ